MIEIEDVTKRFQDTVVLDNITMELLPGHIYGLVGRNGSGKTMLLKTILGFVKPSSGCVRIDGKEIGKDIDIPGYLLKYLISHMLCFVVQFLSDASCEINVADFS